METLQKSTFLDFIFIKSLPLTYHPKEYKIGNENINLQNNINLKLISSFNDFTKPDKIKAANTIVSIRIIPIILPDSFRCLISFI